MPEDDDEVTDLSKPGARAPPQRQGSFSLSATMTFNQDDIKLAGGKGMVSPVGSSVSQVTLPDLDRKKQLGAGATSRVYLAVHKKTGVKYALKELTVMADKDLRHMAVNELRLAHKASQGDHLIKFIDAFFDEGKISICMEFADAGSFEDVIQRGCGGKPGVPEPMTGLMMLQALQGLMYLHREMKQMHRDLKPANCMLTRAGVVKLSDFGISKQLENTESLAVTQCGTTQYMSPERLIGEQYGFESDVWSMGVIILEALYGKLPFPTATNFMSQMMMITKGDPPKAPEGSSAAVHELTAACLRKDVTGPNRRPNVQELFRMKWVRTYAEDGSEADQCKRIAAFIDDQIG